MTLAGKTDGHDTGAALARVRQAIAAAAVRSGRQPEEVTLVAVSKTLPVVRIREAMAFGQRDFGENRAQEAAAKYKELGADVAWHFIGRLQRNKIKQLVAWVDLIHSLDREEQAVEIDRRAGRPLEVLIEVNVAGGTARGGVAPEGVLALLEAVAPLPLVRAVGLMAMAPKVATAEDARPYFRRVAALGAQATQEFPEMGLRHLSMGMSQDYLVAVEEGATLVRVGEAIFGCRSTRLLDEGPLGSNIGPAGTMRGR